MDHFINQMITIGDDTLTEVMDIVPIHMFDTVKKYLCLKFVHFYLFHVETMERSTKQMFCSYSGMRHNYDTYQYVI